jgi:hypothetical protein
VTKHLSLLSKTETIIVFILILCTEILSITVHNHEQWFIKKDPIVQQFIVKHFSGITCDTIGPYGFWFCSLYGKIGY